MRDAAREPADRFHLLRLPELVLELTAVGHVLHRPDHPPRASLGVAEDVRLLVHPADRPVRTHDAMLDIVGDAVGDGRAARRPDRVPIVRVQERVERVGRSLELAQRHAKDAVRFRGPPEPIGAVQLGDPAADVRDLLRLLEERAMVLERFGRADRQADVAEAGDVPDRARSERCGATYTFEHAPVLEAQDVETLRAGSPHSSRRVSFPASSSSSSRPAVENQIRPPRSSSSAEAEHLQIPAVVEDDAPVEIDDEDGVVRGLERRLEQRDGFFLRRTIAHGILAMSMTLSSVGGRVMATACAHIDLVQAVVPPKQHVCEDMRQDRRALGASPDVPDVRRHSLLRLVAKPPRVEARRASTHPVIASAEPGERWLYCYPGRSVRRILTGTYATTAFRSRDALCLKGTALTVVPFRGALKGPALHV